MVAYNTHQAKTHLSEILQRVERKHEGVVICRNGHPVAEVVPWMNKRGAVKRNPNLAKITIAAGAFSPLTEKEWPSDAR